jgi:gluconokinase
MPGDPCILALDIGSSSVRAALYDRTLEAVPMPAAGKAVYRWRTEGGAMEVDPEELFGHLVRVIDDAVSAARDLGRTIAGVGIAAFWHSLLAIDRRGMPLTPLFGWGDARAAVAVPAIGEAIDAAEFRRLTGCFLHPSFPAVKLRWLVDSGASPADAACWTSFPDFAVERLTGRRRTSLSMASATGLLEAGSGRWSARVAELSRIEPSLLPRIVDLEPTIGLADEWASRWPGLAEVPWVPPVGDGACANLGAGAVGEGRPCVTVGTSAAVRAVVPAAGAPAHADLWSYRLDGGYRVAGGALSNGGNVVTYLTGLLGSLDRGRLSERLAGEPDAHGLTILPSLFPERGFGWTRERSAAVLGLRPETGPYDLVAAWLEALAQRLAELLDRLEESFGESAEVAATGGAVGSVPGWATLLADATGRPVRIPDDPEATSRGAAIVAARALGWRDELLVTRDEALVVTPRPGARDLHRRAIERRRRTSDALFGDGSPPRL